MNQTQQFLQQLVIDISLQSELAAQTLAFETMQTVAAKHGYIITIEEMDSVLVQSPELVEQLQALITIDNLDFELDEAVMALISGGTGVDVGTGGSKTAG
jgi:hypothetical protein